MSKTALILLMLVAAGCASPRGTLTSRREMRHEKEAPTAKAARHDSL